MYLLRFLMQQIKRAQFFFPQGWKLGFNAMAIWATVGAVLRRKRVGFG